VTYAFQMVAGALAIGLVVGWVGLLTLRMVRDALTETMVVLAMALGSFAAAEHFHCSGILAVIVAIMFANSVITKRLRAFGGPCAADQDADDAVPAPILTLVPGFDEVARDERTYRTVRANIQFAAVIAASILFISMSNLIDLRLLGRYWKEIFSVFIGTTMIRMAMLGIYARVSHWTDRVPSVPLHWWKILAAAGVKGSFSLLMLHMIPDDAPMLDLLEAVVVGNILLSTFLYPMALVLIIRVHRRRFDEEYAVDHVAYEE